VAVRDGIGQNVIGAMFIVSQPTLLGLTRWWYEVTLCWTCLYSMDCDGGVVSALPRSPHVRAILRQ
jgi:hypothetical protein